MAAAAAAEKVAYLCYVHKSWKTSKTRKITNDDDHFEKEKKNK